MKTIKQILFVCIILVMSACSSETTEKTPPANTPKTLRKTTKKEVFKTEHGSYHEFSAKAKPYSLYVPLQWLMKEHSKSGTLISKAPENKKSPDYQATIEVSIKKARVDYNEQTQKMEVNPMDLADVADNYIKGLQRTFGEMEIDTPKDIKIGGEKAKIFSYTYSNSDEYTAPIKAETSVFYHNNSEIYILTLKEEVAQFEAMQPVFEEIRNSFKFR